MIGSGQPPGPSEARLSVAWLREQLAAHGPHTAPPYPDVDVSLESFVNPPADGLNAALAMYDAFRASEALDELRTARDALLDAYAGLARAFEYEAENATVYDERGRDATETARRVVAGIRSFSSGFRDATDDVCAMAAGLHSLDGARLYPDEVDDEEFEAVYWLLNRNRDQRFDVLSAWTSLGAARLAAAREADIEDEAPPNYEIWVSREGDDHAEPIESSRR
jgi:hypothetical protein